MFKTRKNLAISWIGKSFQVLIHITAFCFFAANIFEIYLEYNEEKTGINRFSVKAESLPLPTVTVCMQDLFKDVDSNTTGEEMLANLANHTYTPTDIFHETFSHQIKKWNPREVFSESGLCIALTPKQNITKSSMWSNWIQLRTNRKYRVRKHYGPQHICLINLWTFA